jgi:SMI1 / KNR4 family.
MPFDLAETFVLAAERELGSPLPVSYRAAMLRENGGELETESDDWELYPIADTSDRKRLSRTANHIIKETQSWRGWPRFPEGALAIAGNGSGDQLVFLKEGVTFTPTVYAWSHETGAIAKVADDFAKLKAL